MDLPEFAALDLKGDPVSRELLGHKLPLMLVLLRGLT